MTMTSCAPPHLTAPLDRRSRVFSCADDVINTTASVYGITRAELLAKDRHRTVAEARQVAMMLIRDLTSMSFPEIARATGRGDHTTVIAGCKRARLLSRQDDLTRARVLEILRVLNQGRELVGMSSCG